MCPAANEAELLLVYANEDGVTQAFLVPSDTPGLTVGPRDKLMGIRAMPTNRVTLEACRIPLANRLGGDMGSDPKLLHQP